MELPVYKIVVNEDDDTGVDVVSFVERPAIQKDFMLFNQQFVEPGAKESEDEFISRCIPYMVGEGMEQEQAAAVCYSKWQSRKEFESYDDYPEAAKENAKVALRWAEENGWGRLMWLAWGGDEGIAWAQRKLQQIDMKQAYSVQDEEKRIVTGPAMLADLPIYRYDDARGEYYVTFDAPTIWTIAKKFVRKNFYKAVNTDHETPVDGGVHMIESYFIDRERGVMPPKGYEDAKDGSWFLTYLVDNDELWAKVKAGEWKGFSVEGFFDMEQQDEVVALMREIAQMLKNFA